VERELRRFLDCGIPANGFARLRCPDCGHERLVAFSCKGRCLCPSCMGRRMAATAAELVDQRLPAVPYRQWVLTLPFPLRFALASNRRFLAAVLRALLDTIFAWQRQRARELARDPARFREAVLVPETHRTDHHDHHDHHDQAPIDLSRMDLHQARPGAVTFLQRFGGAINLNPHYHSGVPDGLFVPADAADPTSPLLFIELPPPTDLEVEELLVAIAARVLRTARRFHLPELTLRSLERQVDQHPLARGARARFRDEPDDDDLDPFAASPEDDPLEDDPQQTLLLQTLAHALTPPLRPAPPPPGAAAPADADPQALALPLAAESVQSDDSDSPTPWLPPPDNLPPPLCARIAGFSLHAARSVETHDRAGLERLCRYGLRPPFAAERLSILPDGRVTYAMRRPWTTRDGRRTHQLVLDPIDFMRRLAALVPPPYFNTVRYHGVFASRNKLHKRLPLPPPPFAAPAAPAPHTELRMEDASEAGTEPSAHPPADTARPPADTARPPADTARPPADTARPPGDTARPPGDTDVSTATKTGNTTDNTTGDTTDSNKPPAPSKHSKKSTGWAALLMRTLDIDALKCPSPGCAGRMVVLAFLTDPRVIARVLDPRTPLRAPGPRAPQAANRPRPRFRL
jgi:hypothetical protein